jgi:lysophospholipase L1-like esterase
MSFKMTISTSTIIVTVFVIILGYLLFLVYPIYHSTKVSKGLIASAVAYEQHPLHPMMHILVAGDSTAVGVGATDIHQTTAGRLGQQYPQADITNIGVSGYQLKDVMPLLQAQQKAGQHYDLILLQIGANDVTRLTPKKTIASEVATIFALCNTMSPKTIVLTAGNMGLSQVFRWPLSTLMTNRSLVVRSIFITTAAEYSTIHYISLFEDKAHDPFEKDVLRYYAPDHFHLTNDGYGIWYGDIKKLL